MRAQSYGDQVRRVSWDLSGWVGWGVLGVGGSYADSYAEKRGWKMYQPPVRHPKPKVPSTRNSGNGTIKGITNHLDYIQGMGLLTESG